MEKVLEDNHEYGWTYQNELRLNPQTLLLDHPVPSHAVPTRLDPGTQRLCRQACSVLRELRKRRGLISLVVR